MLVVNSRHGLRGSQTTSNAATATGKLVNVAKRKEKEAEAECRKAVGFSEDGYISDGSLLELTLSPENAFSQAGKFKVPHIFFHTIHTIRRSNQFNFQLRSVRSHTKETEILSSLFALFFVVFSPLSPLLSSSSAWHYRPPFSKIILLLFVELAC